MVGAFVFEVVCRGASDWRVAVDGRDDHVAFASREDCLGAATARARRRHLDHSVTTEVWVPRPHGNGECIIRFMTPADLEQMLRSSRPREQLREACDDQATPAIDHRR
ncbi:hypothetical protein [Pseudomonas sp. CGJS7]|uniref:hypothetical protein n=1 Tax=Pseudomonas sp. CGJS7 TaxID=3109348 RepID=UPI00300AD260